MSSIDRPAGSPVQTLSSTLPGVQEQPRTDAPKAVVTPPEVKELPVAGKSGPVAALGDTPQTILLDSTVGKPSPSGDGAGTVPTLGGRDDNITGEMDAIRGRLLKEGASTAEIDADLKKLMVMNVPENLRGLQGETLKDALRQLAASCIPASDQDAMAKCEALLKAFEAALSAEGTGQIEEAGKQLEQAMKDLSGLRLPGDSREKLELAGKTMHSIVESRASSFAAVDEFSPQLEKAMAKIASGDPTGIPEAINLLGRMTGDKGAGPLGRQPGVDAKCGELAEAVAATLESLAKAHLNGDANALSKMSAMLEVTASQAKVLEGLLSSEQADGLATSLAVDHKKMTELADANKAASAYLNELLTLAEAVLAKDNSAVAELVGKLANPPQGTLPRNLEDTLRIVTSLLREGVEMLQAENSEKATAALRTAIEIKGMRGNELIKLAGELLGKLPASDSLRKNLDNIIGDCIAKNFQATLDRFNDEVKALQSLLAVPERSSVRTALSGKINELDQRMAVLLTELDKSIGKDALPEGAQGELGRIRDKLAILQKEGLEQARGALMLMRFNDSIDFKLSPDVVAGKSIAQLEAMIGKAGFGKDELAALLTKLAADPGSLSAVEHAKLMEQLDIFLTRKQLGNEPLAATMQKLSNGAPLEDTDVAAIRQMAAFIVTTEEKTKLLEKLAECSANNFKQMQTQLAVIASLAESGAKGLTDQDKVGLTDKKIQSLTEQKAGGLLNFGSNLVTLKEQAHRVLYGKDLADFDKLIEDQAAAYVGEFILKVGEGVKNIDALAKNADLQKLLIECNLNPHVARLLLQQDEPHKFLERINSDPREALKAVDELMLQHPDLDDICLSLKLSLVPAADTQLQDSVKFRHEASLLTRECRSMLANLKGLKGNELEAREIMLKMTDDGEFLTTLSGNMGTYAKKYDLVAVNALWLTFCADMDPVPVGDEELELAFEQFQKDKLHPSYQDNKELKNLMKEGYVSLRQAKGAAKFMNAQTKGYNRESFVYRMRLAIATTTGKLLPRADVIDAVIRNLSEAPGIVDAKDVLAKILEDSFGYGGTYLEVTPETMALLIKKSSAKTDIVGSAITSMQKHTPLKSRSISSSPLGEQIDRAGLASMKQDASSSASSFATRSMRLQIKAKETHNDGLKAIYDARGLKGKPGDALLSNGATLALAVVGVDTILSSSDGWEAMKEQLGNVKLPPKFNILSMEGGRVGVKKAKGADDGVAASAQFRAALDAAKNAGTKEAFDAALATLRGLMETHGLQARAGAVLAFKDADGGQSLEKKFVAAFGKNMPESVLNGIRAKTEGLLGLSSSLAKDVRIASRQFVRSPEYYLSDQNLAALDNAAEAIALKLFTDSVPPVSFSDFVKKLGDDPSAQSALTGALQGAGARDEEAAAALAKFLLARVQDRYSDSEGKTADPNEILSEKAGEINDPQKFNKPGDSKAIANIRSAARKDNLAKALNKLGKGSMLSLDSESKVTANISYKEIELDFSLGCQRGLSIGRDENGDYNLLVSRDILIGMGIGTSLLDDMVSLHAGLEGAVGGGYKFDFDSREKCIDFLNGMLDGKPFQEYSNLSSGLTDLSRGKLGVSFEASVKPLKHLDKLDIPDSITEMADMEFGIKLAAEVGFSSETSGIEHSKTYRTKASGDGSAKYAVGPNKKKLEKELTGRLTFEAELKLDYRADKLYGATMTRIFELRPGSIKDNEQQLTNLLKEYGIDNKQAVKYIKAQLDAGMPVSLSIDATLTNAGMGKYQQLLSDDSDSKSFKTLKSGICLANRENYAPSGLRVSVPVYSKTTEVGQLTKEVEADKEGNLITKGMHDFEIGKVSFNYSSSVSGSLTKEQFFYPTPSLT